jgi:cell division protein ZapA (FtsZ GTPase activity inhibitor)
MSWATAVVVIVAILALAEVLKTKHRARHGIKRDMNGNEEAVQQVDPAVLREVEQLRERVKVLERIATEDRETRQLSAEIDRLRDD